MLAPTAVVTLRIVLPPNTLHALHQAIATVPETAARTLLEDYLPATGPDAVVTVVTTSLETPDRAAGGTR